MLLFATSTFFRFYTVRCNLLEQIGDKSAALRCYKKMLANLKSDQGQDFLNGSREAARLLHEKDQLSQAQSIFDEAFSRFPDLIKDEDVNLFLEMLLILENYEHALEICCKYANVSFDCKDTDDNFANLEPKRQLEAFHGKENMFILCSCLFVNFFYTKMLSEKQGLISRYEKQKKRKQKKGRKKENSSRKRRDKKREKI